MAKEKKIEKVSSTEQPEHSKEELQQRRKFVGKIMLIYLGVSAVVIGLSLIIWYSFHVWS